MKNFKVWVSRHTCRFFDNKTFLTRPTVSKFHFHFDHGKFITFSISFVHCNMAQLRLWIYCPFFYLIFFSSIFFSANTHFIISPCLVSSFNYRYNDNNNNTDNKHMWCATSTIALPVPGFLLHHRRDLKCLRNTIHANLFLTYILSALLWILTLFLQVVGTAN